MATLKEFFGDTTRGDGRIFTHYNIPYFEPMWLDSFGYWVGPNDRGASCSIKETEQVSEWHPPKLKKKVTLWRPIFRAYLNEKYSTGDFWCSDKSYWNSSSNIVAWESREIEVDET